MCIFKTKQGFHPSLDGRFSFRNKKVQISPKCKLKICHISNFPQMSGLKLISNTIYFPYLKTRSDIGTPNDLSDDFAYCCSL